MSNSVSTLFSNNTEHRNDTDGKMRRPAGWIFNPLRRDAIGFTEERDDDRFTAQV
jgi:hypothetical protein